RSRRTASVSDPCCLVRQVNEFSRLGVEFLHRPSKLAGVWSVPPNEGGDRLTPRVLDANANRSSKHPIKAAACTRTTEGLQSESRLRHLGQAFFPLQRQDLEARSAAEGHKSAWAHVIQVLDRLQLVEVEQEACVDRATTVGTGHGQTGKRMMEA